MRVRRSGSAAGSARSGTRAGRAECRGRLAVGRAQHRVPAAQPEEAAGHQVARRRTQRLHPRREARAARPSRRRGGRRRAGRRGRGGAGRAGQRATRRLHLRMPQMLHLVRHGGLRLVLPLAVILVDLLGELKRDAVAFRDLWHLFVYKYMVYGYIEV